MAENLTNEKSKCLSPDNDDTTCDWKDDLVIAIRANVPDAVVIQSPCTMGKGQQAELRKYVAKLELNKEHRVLFAQTVVGMDRP